MIAAMIGALLTLITAHRVQNTNLPKALEGKNLSVLGKIISIPEVRGRRVQFEFVIEKLLAPEAKIQLPLKIKLNWYQQFLQLHYGDRLELTVRLKRPHGFSNPGSFDYEKTLFQKRIRATGYVSQKGKNKKLESKHFFSLNRLREDIGQSIALALQKQRFSGVISALTVGMKHGISPEQWRVFRNTGTSHLVAISGLHIGLIAGLCYSLFGFCWRRSNNWLLKFPTPQVSALGAIFGAFVYSGLAGFALPTKRALIMVIAVMLGNLVKRNLLISDRLSLALIIILIFDPLATLSSSFWLSFFAVGVILFSMSGRERETSLWWRFGRVHSVVTLGLMPLSLLYFNQISLVALPANFIAIPWVGLLVVPLSLLGIFLMMFNPTIGTIILFLSDQLLELLWKFLTILAKNDQWQWFLNINQKQFLLASLGVGIFLLPKGIPSRWLGCMLFLPLIFVKSERPQVGEFWFTLLDVGQGLSLVVQTKQHVLVYDTGPKFSEQFDLGSAVVVPYLRRQGVRIIDKLILSHGDNDHVGGVKSVMKAFPVTRVLSSSTKRLRYLPIEKCFADTSWEWDGVKFEVLHPPRSKDEQGNNDSCVIKISTQKDSVLITGDIEKSAERLLLEEYSEELAATILIAPHHGSLTSSTVGFIQAVDPEHVFFPTGYRNRFRFPHPKVVERYKNQGTKLWNTASCGSIRVLFRQDSTRIQNCHRLDHQRYWHS